MGKYKFIKKSILGFCLLLMCVQPLKMENEKVDADVTVIQGDFNGDGKVNVMDKIYVKQYKLGERTTFPVTNWRVAAGVTDIGSTVSDFPDVNKYILKAESDIFIGEDISCFNGIDVSKWQGVIDWNTVKEAGIDFVMIKAGEGLSIEETFFRNIEGAKKAGVQCGIYWFANARTVEQAKLEAMACKTVMTNYKLEYPVVYDFEYRTLDNNNPLATDRKAATDAIIAFLDIIAEHNYYPMVYSNKDFPNRYLEIERITEKYDFWYANLSVTTPDVECTMWQYSHTGRVPGIPEIVDRDYSFIDYKSRMIELGLNGY